MLSFNTFSSSSNNVYAEISFDLSAFESSKEEYLLKPLRSKRFELLGYLLSNDIKRFCNLDPEKNTWYIQL